MKEMKQWVMLLVLGTGMSFGFSACSDDENLPDNGGEEPTESTTTGVYILNSGRMSSNNSTLDYYDPLTQELTGDVFAAVNGRGLGDTANDMLIYGSKMYIAVTNSNTIEVTDLNAKSLATISPKDEGGQPQSPRYLTAYDGKVYASLFDGHVAAIDTASLEISQQIQVGPNPEQLCVSGGKLYVVNSGGYNEVQDSTVSVINPTTFSVEKTLTVVVNPTQITADSEGYLYVVSNGNYADIRATLQRVNPETGERTVIVTNDQFSTTLVDDKLYIITAESNASTDWQRVNTKYMIYDTRSATMETENFITDGTEIPSSYYISVSPTDHSIYVTSSDYINTGDVYVYSNEGKQQDVIAVSGINPMCARFITE